MAAGSSPNADYQVDVEAARATLGNVVGVVFQSVNIARDLGRHTVSGEAFGQLGAPAATAAAQLHGQLTSTLDGILQGLQETSDLTRVSLDGYDQENRAAADQYQVAAAQLDHPIIQSKLGGGTGADAAAVQAYLRDLRP